MKRKIWVYILAAKYWLQGDEWSGAKVYANVLVNGFRKIKK